MTMCRRQCECFNILHTFVTKCLNENKCWWWQGHDDMVDADLLFYYSIFGDIDVTTLTDRSHVRWQGKRPRLCQKEMENSAMVNTVHTKIKYTLK